MALIEGKVAQHVQLGSLLKKMDLHRAHIILHQNVRCCQILHPHHQIPPSILPLPKKPQDQQVNALSSAFPSVFFLLVVFPLFVCPGVFFSFFLCPECI
jgi:hypothetical protein